MSKSGVFEGCCCPDSGFSRKKYVVLAWIQLHKFHVFFKGLWGGVPLATVGTVVCPDRDFLFLAVIWFVDAWLYYEVSPDFNGYAFFVHDLQATIIHLFSIQLPAQILHCYIWNVFHFMIVFRIYTSANLSALLVATFWTLSSFQEKPALRSMNKSMTSSILQFLNETSSISDLSLTSR